MILDRSTPMTFTLLPAVDVAGRHGGPAGAGRGRHRDPLRRPARGRAGLAARRRRVGAPGRPRRGVRPRQQRATLLAEVVGALDIARRAVRRHPRRRVARRGAGHRLRAGSTSAPPRWRTRTGCARAIAEHGDRIAVGLDVRGATLSARGWTREGGDLCEMLARLDADGCARYVVTDVRRDGTLAGPNLDLLPPTSAPRPTRPVVASGGVSSLDDLRALAALAPLGVEGAIVGKALYAGAFTLPEALRRSS